ncbi:MAG: gamma-glutamyltransferase family protein [Desulfatiglandales bacterium]
MSAEQIFPNFEQSRSSHRPVIRGTTGMVVSGHHLATQAGVRILEKGGNAIDAGVAAGICLGVLQSDMVNFAGVAPLMVYLANTNEIKTISGLGPWPKGASVDYFIENFDGKIPEDIQRTVVPAAPDAWIKAIGSYGTMSFEEVSRDAIYLAEHGFPMHQFMSKIVKEKIDGYKRWPSSAEVFLPNGRPPEPGEIFVQRDLAETIKKMVRAEQKKKFAGRDEALQAARDVFYKGEIAEAILDYHKKNDGLLRREDFEHFQSAIEEPLKTTYSDYEIYSCRPWCQGPVLLQALNIVEGFDLKAMGHNSLEYIHLIAGALNLVYSDREKFYGDPDFVDVPVVGLLSKAYAEARRGLIDTNKAWAEMPLPGDPWKWQGSGGNQSGEASQKGPNPPGNHGKSDRSLDTSYVCVVDKYGNAFSATPSDFSFTTPIIPPTGLAVSSRGAQSWVDHNHPSSIQGGKRPRLTPTPSMVFRRGKLFMPFGTPGGDVQCQAMLQVFLNVVEFGMDPQEAVEAPRFATFNFPNSFFPHAYNKGLLNVEKRIEDSTLNQLKEKGHGVELWPDWAWKAGAVCAIVVDSANGVLLGAADPRRESYALGW